MAAKKKKKKKDQDYSVISVYLLGRRKKKLKKLAGAMDRSMTDLAEEILNEWLDSR